jgi:protein gp37
VFRTMQECPQHTFQVLTKRSQRLRVLGASLPWPKNVWMGVSVESNEVIHRVRDLAAVPAHVRFLSCEPLIGPLSRLPLKDIHWVIVGGESGPGARPMNPEWVESIQQQCNRSKALFFFKQWGGVRKDMTGRELHGRTYDDMPLVQHSSIETTLFPQLA